MIKENKPKLNPSQTEWYSIFLLYKDKTVSSPGCWLYSEMVYLSADNHPS